MELTYAPLGFVQLRFVQLGVFNSDFCDYALLRFGSPKPNLKLLEHFPVHINRSVLSETTWDCDDSVVRYPSMQAFTWSTTPKSSSTMVMSLVVLFSSNPLVLWRNCKAQLFQRINTYIVQRPKR